MGYRAACTGRISSARTSAPSSSRFCDSEEKINAFLPILDDMMESGLVTLEKARVLQYGKKRSGYIERLKKSMRGHLHLDDAGEGPETQS